MKRKNLTVLLLLTTLSATSLAGLNSSLRLKALPLLIPNDPENFLLQQLPEVELQSTTKLETNYQAKRNNPALEDVNWQSLAINFLLQQKYINAITCLEHANNNAEDQLTYYLPFKAYAMQQTGRISDAQYFWKQQINEQEGNRPVLTQLIACEILQRHIIAAKTLANTLPEDHDDELTTSYLQAIMTLSRGNLFEAQRQLVHIIQQPQHPPEAYLALAISSLERGGEYDVIGWLKKAFENSSPYQQHLIANHPAFAPLQKHPSYTKLLEKFAIQLNGETNTLSPPLLSAYQKKYKIPKTLRINLALRLQRPEMPPQFQGLRLTKKKKE